MKLVSLDKRYELIHQRVTLNGKPAIIKGAKNEFAQVCAQVFPFEQAEYAWSTVERVVENNNGRFSTRKAGA